MSSKTKTATAYPTREQYERWTNLADDLDMTISEFVQAMVEAGIKAAVNNFEPTVQVDETNRELRSQRNDLSDELTHARDRIERLENRLHRSEREVIIRYVQTNPGATYNELVQHVLDTVPARVNEHLEELEGTEIRADDGEYYPKKQHD